MHIRSLVVGSIAAGAIVSVALAVPFKIVEVPSVANTPLGKRNWKLMFSSTSLKRGSPGVLYIIAFTSVGSSPERYRAAFRA